ncbi:MAG: LolA family protein [Bacteroidota bacterium]|jgi:outer membrane lipoprotein carrier protein
MKNNLKNTFFATIILWSGSILAQEQDPKAKSILDEMSKITKSYKTISADYLYTITGKDKKIVEKQDGKIKVKGTKFRLEIPGNSIVCDGKKVYNHNKEQQEVSIKCFQPTDDDGMNPTKIFTIYEKGYKFKFEKEEKNSKGLITQIISLTPTVKPEKKKYHTAKIYIDKSKKQIITLQLMMKDGSSQSFDIKKFSPNLEITDSEFNFDTKKFKPDQVVDECE